MHLSAFRYIQATLVQQQIDPAGKDVVEFGSYIVNGTIRPLFEDSVYWGIDLRDGPGVDSVADGATYGKKESHDIVVSCEALEHYSNPEAVVANAARILKPGGYLLLTAASLLRAPHGNDGNAVEPGEFYAGIDPKELESWLVELFDEYEVTENTAAGDVYAWARKAA